jgi:hypothetical protein
VGQGFLSKQEEDLETAMGMIETKDAAVAALQQELAAGEVVRGGDAVRAGRLR